MKKLLLAIIALLAMSPAVFAQAQADVYLVKTQQQSYRVNHGVWIDLSEFGAGARPISVMIRTRYSLYNGSYYPGVTDYAYWGDHPYDPEEAGTFEDPDGDKIFKVACDYYYMLFSNPPWSLQGVSVEGNVSFWPGVPYLPYVVFNKQFSIGTPNVAGNIPPGSPQIPQVLHGWVM